MKIVVNVDNQTYEVEIDDLQSRPILATIDGKTFEVWPDETEADKPAVAAPPAIASTAKNTPIAPPVAKVSGQAAAPAKASNALLSPLPGTVYAIAVREGEEVKTGQELLTLEAMKMKNAIRSARDGKVAAIRVSVGDQVRHNQVLLEYAN